jgi:hypothetical protein
VGRVKFHLNVDNEKVFTDLNFSEAIQALFSVAFIGNIHYPEIGEAVAILLKKNWLGRMVKVNNL